MRLAAAVALGRKQTGGLAAFLDDADSRVVAAAARAIHDESTGDELPALAAIAGRDDLTEATRRRAMNAAFRLGALYLGIVQFGVAGAALAPAVATDAVIAIGPFIRAPNRIGPIRAW